MSGVKDEVARIRQLRDRRFKQYAEHGPWGAFVLATIQGTIEEINGLKLAEGRRLVATRQGDYRNWDPDVLGVDEAAEGYIFDALKQFGATLGGLRATVLSEEAGAKTLDLGAGMDVIVISDPFDGSLLYKNDLGAFYYTTVSVWDTRGGHLATAVGDCVNNRVDFAGGRTAFSARYTPDGLADLRHAKPSSTTDLARVTMETYLMKPKYLYQEPDDAYSFVETFKPLLSQVKFISGNGGPSGFTDVALGRTDLYLAHKQPLIDVFSGIGVALTAGAVITTFDGEPVQFSTDINSRHYILCTSNRALHQKVLRCIADIKRQAGLTWRKVPNAG